jgi:hypothetical protein
VTARGELLSSSALKPRGPTNQQRVIVLGRTGSGKSQFAIALLSTRDWHLMPWIIIDYKGEDLIEDIRDEAAKIGAPIREIMPTDKVPKQPGLYYMRPAPLIDDDAVNNFMFRVWKQGHVGLFIDEGYALPQSRSGFFYTILTQGRSLYIPVIILYQRPVYMSRFAVAQADFFAVFEQNDERDLKTTAQYVKAAKGPNNEVISVFSPLPKYHCIWYDVSEGFSTVLTPAPSRDSIIEAFLYRLKPIRRKALI